MYTKPSVRHKTADEYLSIVLWTVVGLSAFLIATFGYGRDQGIYTVVARTILEGGMPYRDAFDFKPPGIYLLYALARIPFGSWHHGIRIFEAAGMIATVFGLAHLSERWWGDRLIGLLAGAAAALVHAQLDFWHTGQPETFGGMLTVAGLVVGTRKAESASQYVFCGLLFGCGGVLKPPLAGGGAVLALWAAYRALDHEHRSLTVALADRWRQALRPIAYVLIGGVLPFVAVLVWFAAKGALGDLYETLFVFTPHYTKLGWKDRTIFSLAYQAWAQWLVTFSSFMAVGTLLALAQWRRVWARSHTGLVLGIIAIYLLGVALQGKFFPYHYAGAWPVTALIASLGWHGVWCWAKGRGRFAIGAFAVAACSAAALRAATKDLAESFWFRSAKRFRVFLLTPNDRAGREELASVADVSAAGNRQVAEELQRTVPAGAPVYIWGFEPVIYDMADRPFASTYLYNVPQRVEWAAKDARATLMQHLRNNPPAAIVVAHHDVFPMVTGNAIDSHDVLHEEFGELARYLEESFGEPKRVQDFDIFWRKSTGAEPSPSD